ncbi:MAG: ATP-dependent DNA helicase RecG [bacterium]
MLRLDSPITQVPGVGSKTSKLFQKLDLLTVGDLLKHFPFRYEDWSQITMSSIMPINKPATLLLTIDKITSRTTWKRRLSLVTITAHDDSGPAKLIWFNQPYIATWLKEGATYLVAGKRKDGSLPPTLTNPTTEPASRLEEGILPGVSSRHSARIVPIYSTTQSLSIKSIRNAIANSLKHLVVIPDPLPEATKKKYKLGDITRAYNVIHFPDTEESLKEAKQRLGFDELLIVQLLSRTLRRSLEQAVAPAIPFDANKAKSFLSSWPFSLTQDQKKASWEIIQDLEQTRPMNRLLQGDVGSGKTAVAALTAWTVAQAKHQTVLLAPTELLAQQHHRTFQELLGSTAKIALHTAAGTWVENNKIPEKQFLKLLSSGYLDVVIGTHALLSEKIVFNKLGMVIIDEQQRFGVKQRQALRDRTPGQVAHFLSMTATPIPRSLALTVYGDLDASIIKEMPPGRKQTIAKLAGTDKEKQAVFKKIKEEIKNKRQVFIVCSLIDPNDNGLSVTEVYEDLNKNIFPDLRMAIIHGQQDPNEQKNLLKKFYAGQLDIIVATTVIEVGMNVPNASVMVIYGAERFGLATLHQLRGRVGRSEHQSYCYVFLDDNSQPSRKRLEYFCSTTDGFKLAEYDLETRGYGQLYGKEQSGFISLLKVADWKDQTLVKMAKQAATELLRKDPLLRTAPLLKQQVERLKEETHWE